MSSLSDACEVPLVRVQWVGVLLASVDNNVVFAIIINRHLKTCAISRYHLKLQTLHLSVR